MEDELEKTYKGISHSKLFGDINLGTLPEISTYETSSIYEDFGKPVKVGISAPPSVFEKGKKSLDDLYESCIELIKKNEEVLGALSSYTLIVHDCTESRTCPTFEGTCDIDGYSWKYSSDDVTKVRDNLEDFLSFLKEEGVIGEFNIIIKNEL